MKMIRTIATSLLCAIFASLTVPVFAIDRNAEDVLNFNVKERGVYQVTHELLLAFGLDISGQPLTRIALMNAGRPVSIELKGSDADNSVFGVGAYLRFIGEGLDTLYTDTNVYTLRLDSDAHQTIEEREIALPERIGFATSYLAKATYAPQNEYSFASPDEQDPWYASRVLALNQPASESVSLELEGFVPGGNSGSTSAKLNVNVWGATDLPGGVDDHHIRVRFNGQTVLDETFDGFAIKDMSADIANVRTGTNTVNLEMPLDQGFDFDAVNLNKIEVRYPRGFIADDNRLFFTSASAKFRVSGFDNGDIAVYQRSHNGDISKLTAAETSDLCVIDPSRCSIRFGGTGRLSDYYVVATDSMLEPEFAYVPIAQDIRSGGAEYLIITHPDFIVEPGERDLLNELASDLQNSYSSVDIVDVEQIYAQFGNHLYDPEAIRRYINFASQTRGTRTVLLVGGDIYDYRGFQNQNARSFIPSIYMATGDMINFAPVDAKYVDLDDNNTPDLAIARFPVRTLSELETLLDKRTAYLNRSYRDKMLFTADGFDDLQQYSFQLDALSIEQEFFADRDVAHAFLDEMTADQARIKIIQEIGEGTSLTAFFGHSSTSQWTFDGLFNSFDAANLNNPNRPTIVTQWGCWNTYYVNPNEDSMGHRFLVEGNRGAVAVMGATTLTSASNEKALARLVFERLSNGERLGQAVVNAKAEFAESRPEALDVILGWTLLGPPELQL